MSKVLLIEDEDFIRDLYKRQLDLNGFQTDTAANGKEGIALLGTNSYEVLLLDIMLPDTNGLEILKLVKSNPKNDKATVVLLSNLGQDVVVQEGFRLGAEGYLIKASLTPNQVVEEIKNILINKQNKAKNL